MKTCKDCTYYKNCSILAESRINIVDKTFSLVAEDIANVCFKYKELKNEE